MSKYLKINSSFKFEKENVSGTLIFPSEALFYSHLKIICTKVWSWICGLCTIVHIEDRRHYFTSAMDLNWMNILMGNCEICTLGGK